MTTTTAPPAAVARRSMRSRLSSSSPFEIAGWTVGLLLVGLATYPLLRVVARLFWVDGEATLAPIRNTLDQPDLGSLIFNTIVVVLASGVIALVSGALLAWCNERTDARMGPLTDAL